MTSPRSAALLLFCLLMFGLAGVRGQEKQPSDKAKEIAGKSEFLRSVPKHFATLKAVDPALRRVTLLLEGESLAKVWDLTADAEIKVAGWWGRLDQLTVGDRVWAWFETNRAKQPVAIFMLADEISEQDIHGPGAKLEAVDAGTGTLTLKSATGKSRVLPAKKAQVLGGKAMAASSLDKFTPGGQVYVQTAEDQVRLVLDPEAFEAARVKQQAALRKRWTDEGLPGTVVFLHRFTGEMELMLDHEAIRWGRTLKPGDQVTLPANPPIPAVVRQVRPWRERTQVRLVVAAADLGDLSTGQRVALRMTAPSAEVETAALPPGLDEPRSKPERIEWFLAHIYCTCKVKGDGCTGHFYTLSSCNPNACGMPNTMRKNLAEKIDKGLTDKQIFEELLNDRGNDLIKPHLLP